MKTGNVKQVAAFGKLVGMCNDLGASYDPSKAALTPTALTSLLEQAQQSVEAVTVARATLILAINTRQETYAGLKPLAARIVRALAACESSEQNILDARIIKRKLSKGSSTSVNPEARSGEEGSKTSWTSSRLDYDGKADTFASLIQLLKGIPAYAPNEAELKLSGLKTVLATLRSTTNAVDQATRQLSTARIHRNKVLKGKGGMFETATAVKEYIRSVFGVSSEPARELGKLRLAA